MDYEKEVAGVAALVPEDYKLAPETIPIAREALESIDRRYGPDSDDPLEYHNAPHSLDVARGAIRQTNLLFRFIPPRWRAKIYDLDMVGAFTHDHEQRLGWGENERVSGEYGVSLVENMGGELNNAKFKKRLYDGNLATTVEIADGRLVQPYLQKGSHDPFKFILAFADKNGVAIEGPLRMLKDATRIYYEMCDEPTAEGLYKFLTEEESKFLRQGLNDFRVKADIAYSFPDSAEEVYEAMRDAYHENIKSSHGMAIDLGNRPELKTAVGALARSIALADRAILGDRIARMIHKKLA